MIISASRRTDIPAFFGDWFMTRIREGFVFTRNPFNKNQIKRISLQRDAVDCIVFWTKDPRPMMKKKQFRDLCALGYPYYVHFTLTPYDETIEPRLGREKDALLDAFRELSLTLGRESVIWRYDPIILTKTLTEEFHYESFYRMAQSLRGFTSVCTISFVDLYAKARTNLKQIGVIPQTKAPMVRLAKTLREIADSLGFSLQSCAEDLSPLVLPGSCVDKNRIEQKIGRALSVAQDKNQRKGCHCVQSVDVGAYATCSHFCLYCYANQSPKAVLENIKKHQPSSPFLLGE